MKPTVLLAFTDANTHNAQAQHLATAVVHFLLTAFAEPLTIGDLAAACGSSRYKFCRDFSAAFGISPIRWLWVFRTLLAAEFMRLAPSWSLTDIAFACGFNSSAHFSRQFKSVFNESPTAHRQRLLASHPVAAVSSIFDDNAATVRKVARHTFDLAVANPRQLTPMLKAQ